MNKFFDYLMGELSDKDISDLLGYICRFANAFAGDVPVEGKLGSWRFCATAPGDGQVRVHWVEVGAERIAVNATV